MRITTIDDGKYTIENDNGLLAFKRHGEAWPAADDLRHSGVVLALVQRIEELEKLQEVVNAAHQRLDNVVAANAIPMPPALRELALVEFTESMRNMLAGHISYDPAR